MRNLASIQRILSIRSIKGEFNVGDLCVYCEIDSLLPEKPEFEFLRKNNFRIRTLRLRGAISQGICFPLSILPEGIEVKEEMDVTDLLGIIKYDPPEPACLGDLFFVPNNRTPS